VISSLVLWFIRFLPYRRILPKQAEALFQRERFVTASGDPGSVWVSRCLH
jgi:hypothetical protein